MEELPHRNTREILLAELDNHPLLTDQDRSHILLVLEGLKQACVIELVNPDKAGYVSGHEDEYEQNTEDFNNTVRELEELFRKLNIPYYMLAEHVEEEEGLAACTVNEFFIGKDPGTLEKLKNMEAEPDDEKKQTEFARIMDIPATAIDAWNHGNIKDPKTLPDSIKKSELINFVDFALSADHWQEELEFVKKRADAIKNLAPDLYTKIVDADYIS